jgi:hypothetical protein
MLAWFRRNQNEITWFIIGWLSLSTVDALGRGDWFFVLINSVLIWVNLQLNKQ